MSTCAKTYTINETTGLLSAYWPMEDTGLTLVDQVDKTIGRLLRPSNLIMSVPGGIQGSCLWFAPYLAAPTNISSDLVHSVPWPPTYFPEMTLSSIGFSIVFWFKAAWDVVSWPVFYIEMDCKFAGLSTVLLRVTHSADVTGSGNAYISINGFGVATINFNRSNGAWDFYHVYWNGTTSKFGLRMNGGAPVEVPMGASFTTATYTHVKLWRQIHFPDAYVDELGIWMNYVLTDAQAGWLYNGGAGRTWPDVNSIP